MATHTHAVEFGARNLAAQIEQLTQDELDHLPFGVILLDRDGRVIYYSQTEAELSGYGKIPFGENLFAISPCMGSTDFRGRIERAMRDGPVDLEFDWTGDFADPQRDLRLRVISQNCSDVWIFIDREGAGKAVNG